jgi:hypothetical protein
VIIATARTAITRARKGGFKDSCPEDLLVAVFEAVADRSGIDKSLVEEIQVGTVLAPGGGATIARMAQLAGSSTFLLLLSALGNPVLTPATATKPATLLPPPSRPLTGNAHPASLRSTTSRS